MAKENAAEKKARLVAEAGALGLSVEGLSVKKLEAAIEQAKLGGDQHAPKGDFVAGKLPKGHDVAHVDDEGGRIRTYSKEVHGDDFFENANEFASKVAGRVVVTE